MPSNTPEQSGAAEKPFDATAFILAYEGEQLTEDEVVAGFQQLINSGLAWELQGSYGRMANDLIEQGHCTRPPKKEPDGLKNHKPFESVSAVAERTINGEQFRILLYGAYNAMGLIGYESNGVAVISLTNRSVVVDELAKEDSGYFGASEKQKAFFEKMRTCDASEFRSIVNSSSRCRNAI